MLKNKVLSPDYVLRNIQKAMVWRRFMGVLVKTIHAVIAENKDPKLEIKKRLMNYRITPHPATGKVPAELVFRLTIEMKIPRRPRLLGEKEIEEARVNDEKSRLKQKEELDGRKKTVEMKVKVGDTVLVKLTKTTTKPPFDPNPYRVVEVNGTQTVLDRDGKRLKRSFNKIKGIKDNKEKRKILEKAAHEGVKKGALENSPRGFPRSFPPNPQTDDKED